jgi:hypothetical protein
MRTICLLLLAVVFAGLLPKNVALAKNKISENDRDAAAVEGLFRSMRGRGEEGKREIIRRIVLFPGSKITQQEVILPNLLAIMLQAKEAEGVRREAIKGLITIINEKRIDQPFVLLLKKNLIRVDDTIEAMKQTGESRFATALMYLFLRLDEEKSLREMAVLGFLSLWEAEGCNADWFNDFQQAFDTLPPAAHNPAFEPLKKLRSDEKSSTQLILEKIIEKSPSEITTDQQLKGQLLLGCAGKKEVMPLLLSRFNSEMETQRLVMARFFGSFKEKQSIPALGDCSRRDPAKTVRSVCLHSLIEIATVEENSPQVLSQLKRNYSSSKSLRERQSLVDSIYGISGGETLLKKLASKDRSRKMRRYIEELLQRHGPKPLPSTNLFDQTQPQSSQ